MSMLLNPFVFAVAGGGGSIPPGAIAFLDFVNGFYYAGGAERAVTDLLGGGFDPGSISGSGMYVTSGPTSSSNRPNAIGSLFSDMVAGLAAGCTIVFDIDFVSGAYGRLANFMDAADENATTDYVILAFDGGTSPVTAASIEDQDDVFLEDTGDLQAGTHIIGQILARDVGGGSFQYATSTDGGAVETQTVSYPPFAGVTTITLFHDGLDNVRPLDNSYIKSITLYPAMDPADLPALTA